MSNTEKITEIGHSLQASHHSVPSLPYGIATDLLAPRYHGTQREEAAPTLIQ